MAAPGNDTSCQMVAGVAITYKLARKAIAAGVSLQAMVEQLGLGEMVDIRAALAEGWVLAPIDHADPPT